jgi:N-acetylmuramoyl-L-alanine amidase
LAGRPGAPGGDSLVKDFRFGLLSAGRSRIIIDLARPACPADVSTRAIVDGAPAARLTIEMKPCDPAAFAALVRQPAATTILTPDAPPLAQQPVIVLDPGHGGVDSGASGLGGVQEKTLVFEFCAELKRRLDATKRYKVVMTRDGDQFVTLDDRVDLARAAKASLFISVHADTLTEDSDVGGSTVYTVADRASDAEAARIATRENAVDQGAGGLKRSDNPDVADILFDLRRRETRTFAHIFSRGLVGALRGATKLNHNPERSAGFVVLRAPEFPSVLVELGYLSNAQDVRSLASPEWRAKSAGAMVDAIDAFFSGAGKPETGPAGDPGIALSGGQALPRPGH